MKSILRTAKRRIGARILREGLKSSRFVACRPINAQHHFGITSSEIETYETTSRLARRLLKTFLVGLFATANIRAAAATGLDPERISFYG